MKLFPNGDKVFEVISRYDDLLTIEGRQGYEPGDTLALIVPFLLLHNITEADIKQLAEKATFINGAVELISRLQKDGWQVFCITTTYEQYARHLTQKLGIEGYNVASTPFRLNSYMKLLCQDSTALLQDTESSIVDIIDNDSLIKAMLDDFFWQKLPKTEIGRAIKEVKPIGGSRKVTALKRFAKFFKQPLAEWVAVGDSITDFRMLKEVNRAGGISIAFNANQYALPYATLGLASMAISDLEPILSVWHQGGKDEVKQLVIENKKGNLKRDRVYFQWLADNSSIDEVISTHGKMRRLVREEAGKLG
ncbi:MAG: HAD hydrolase family protein [Dehalococcoidia bacterium]|nr:MAG: HAD hydrolase family protein [Dehalococcoidia bacterium]